MAKTIIYKGIGARPTAGAVWSLAGIIKKYWYWIVLLLIVTPALISSIKVAVDTQNPSYPVFVLAGKLLASDQVMENDVNLLREGQAVQLIGMDKPETGIFKTVKYWFLWFWNIPVRLFSEVWLLFFPLVLIFKILHPFNTSEIYKTWLKAIGIFVLFLFITNTVLFIHGLIAGNIYVDLPTGSDQYKEYWYLFIETLPFHGLVNLVIYLVQLGAGSVPPPY